jgi:hypothetical protein
VLIGEKDQGVQRHIVTDIMMDNLFVVKVYVANIMLH